MALIRPAVQVDPTRRRYDGSQLRPHWIYQTFGLQGDAAVAFVGEVDVGGEDLVDLADRRGGLFIAGEAMLHVILESFGPDLDRAVFLQRLLVLLAREQLAPHAAGRTLRRDGDDLWLDEGKLSVSIATVSAVSCLVHFGINVTNDGTPIPTASLADLKLEPLAVAGDLLAGLADEVDGMAAATTKVRSVP